MSSFRQLPWYAITAVDPGHKCETCGRFLKVYKRSLSSSMAVSLIRLHQLRLQRLAQPRTPKVQPNVFFHVRDFDRDDGRGEISKLALWGLVREVANDDPRKRASGLWTITQFGIRFVRCQEAVPKYILLKWNTELLGFAGSSVKIIECLGEKFDYAALMAR